MFLRRKKPYIEKQSPVMELKKSFPGGMEFEYLNRVLKVKGHSEYWPGVGVIPTLTCLYADDHGVLREIKFDIREASDLRNALRTK